MKLSTIIFSIVISTLLSACANPEIVQMSADTYMLARADHAGIFGNTTKLKASVIKDASTFAQHMGKVAIPLYEHETPLYPGHCATFEYQFRIIDKDAPEAKRAHLSLHPDVVIEKNENIEANIKTEQSKPNQFDTYSELIRLDDLRKKGIITDSEFDAEKVKLLNRTN